MMFLWLAMFLDPNDRPVLASWGCFAEDSQSAFSTVKDYWDKVSPEERVFLVPNQHSFRFAGVSKVEAGKDGIVRLK